MPDGWYVCPATDLRQDRSWVLFGGTETKTENLIVGVFRARKARVTDCLNPGGRFPHDVLAPINQFEEFSLRTQLERPIQTRVGRLARQPSMAEQESRTTQSSRDEFLETQRCRCEPSRELVHERDPGIANTLVDAGGRGWVEMDFGTAEDRLAVIAGRPQGHQSIPIIFEHHHGIEMGHLHDRPVAIKALGFQLAGRCVCQNRDAVVNARDLKAIAHRTKRRQITGLPVTPQADQSQTQFHEMPQPDNRPASPCPYGHHRSSSDDRQVEPDTQPSACGACTWRFLGEPCSEDCSCKSRRFGHGDARPGSQGDDISKHQSMKRLSLYQTPAAAWASDAAAFTKESCWFKGICDLFQGGKVYPGVVLWQQQNSRTFCPNHPNPKRRCGMALRRF